MTWFIGAAQTSEPSGNPIPQNKPFSTAASEFQTSPDACTVASARAVALRAKLCSNQNHGVVRIGRY